MAEAGWYPDAHDPNSQHYFDGQNWTGHRRANPAGAADETVRRGDLPADPAAQQWPSHQQPEQEPQQPQQQPSGQWAPQQAPTQQWAPQQGQYAQPYAQPYSAQPYSDQSYLPAENLPAPPARSRKRTPIVVAAAAAVVVAAGVITYLVWPDDEPSLTYRGKEIANAADTLKQGEELVAKTVEDRRGAKNDDTRCYFAKPEKAASGGKASDVEDSLRCGPVLFVDGERRAAYLSVPLTEKATGSSVQLSVPDDLGSRDPAALGEDLNLVRPDGAKPPTANDGAGDLDVPKPPAGEANLLTTAPLDSSARPNEVNTSITGRTRKVMLESVAEIERYGVGDDARSAPDGQRLIAFRLDYGPGDVSSGTTPATLNVPGGTPRPIPDAVGDDYVVAAVPASGGASIVLADSGVTQSISLPSGKPAAGTIAVLQRSSRAVLLSSRFDVPITLKRGGDTRKTTFKATATAASLDFWAPANPSVRASSPSNALLTVRLTYTSSLDKGKTFGFDPKLLTLQYNGKSYKARNVAPAGKISNVFEVPANFTAGTLRVAGSSKVGSVTVSVGSPKSLVVRIPG